MISSSNPQLNPNQQQAVEFNDGPLLIVAGAGTGKTFTLVEKIKYLIKEKLAKPEEILCLTFTEKAAYEMEERVDQAMPYGYFQMWISTFHSFADEVLRDEIHQLGLSSRYTLMSQAQTILFLRRNLFNLKLDYYRPLSNPTKFIEALLQHFARLRDEDISPEEYKRWVADLNNTNVETSRRDHSTLKHDLTIEQLNNETIDPEELKKLQELSHAYEIYQKLKIENEVFDFDDLIFYVNKLFRERKSVLKQYQKRFKYVLVDEFQDTNISQYELIKLLCPPKSKPNLTVVGDDSQAIYKFRGASVSNIMNFMSDYKNAKQVSLIDNYRSNQSVLDHAYRLIQHNNPDTLESKLGISKELIARRTAEKDRNVSSMSSPDLIGGSQKRDSRLRGNDIRETVEFELFQHGDLEADWIAKKILELRKEKKYEFKDFAVLVRANDHSDPIIRSLAREGIPYQFLGPGTLFKQPEVKDLIAYLKVLSDLEDNVSLFRVLSMEFFKLDEQDLVLLLSFAKKISLSYFQAIEVYLSFFHEEWYRPENSNYKEHLPLLREETRQILIEFMKMFKDHLKKVRKYTAGQILYSFLEDSKYLEYISNPQSETEEKRTLNISKLFTKLKNLENEMEDASVFAIVEYINMSMELGESPLVSDTDAAVANAVNILTVHSAKGLEFPVVFLSNLVNGRFPTYRRREPIPIPDELIKETLPEGDFHIQEERRLFYVGLTRAMDKAYLTAAEIYGDGVRKRKISPFVIETMGKKAVEKKQVIRQEEEAQISIFDFKINEVPIVPEPVTVKNISYSQLQTYDLCPLQYKYQYVLKIPTVFNAAASFGSTIHRVLQKFYEGYVKDRSYSLNHMMNLLEESWMPVGYSSASHQTRMKKEAKDMLEKFYTEFHHPEIDVLNLEQFFKVKIGRHVNVTGKIDRVDRKGDLIEVIDYKTGKQPDERTLQKDLQLSIYALAASNEGLYKKPIEKIELSYYYLQNMQKVSLKRTAKDLEVVQEKVENTVEKIKRGEFPANVGPWCDFCSFRMICEAWQ